ncbi:MAG: hypothetical protein ACYS5W_21335, partial [Planctomycetota bacterium]
MPALLDVGHIFQRLIEVEILDGCTGQPTFDGLESEIPDGDSQQLTSLMAASTAGSRLQSGRSSLDLTVQTQRL